MKLSQIPLGELIHIKHGWAFKGEYFSDSGKYVLLTPGNCHESGGLKLKGNKEKYYTGQFPEDFLLKQDDLIVVMTDLVQAAPILGGAFIIPENGIYLHNQRLGLVGIKNVKGLNQKYLYYALNNQAYRAQVRGSATGVTVKHTAPERIYRCTIPFPDKPVQDKIADILSAYDDLIENNRRRIDLLEQSARLLYKEWFVSLRFPGHEHVKVKDGVPQGWEIGKIEDLGEIITGKTPSTKEQENYDGDIPFVKTPDMHTQIVVTKTEQQLSERGAKLQENKFLPKGAVMVSCIGTVGVVAIAGSRCQTNQQINSVVCHDPMFNYYAYYALLDLKPRLESMSGGVTMPNVSKSKFSVMPIMIPDKKIVSLFDEAVMSNFVQIETLSIMNEKLQQARDLLLPRLMNGEIPV